MKDFDKALHLIDAELQQRSFGASSPTAETKPIHTLESCKHVLSGMKYELNKDLDCAKLQYELAIEKDSLNAFAYLSLGYILDSKGDFKQAAEILEKAQDRCFYRTLRKKKKKLFGKKPTHPPIRPIDKYYEPIIRNNLGALLRLFTYRIGCCQDDMGKQDLALEEFNSCISQCTSCIHAFFNRGKLYRQRGSALKREVAEEDEDQEDVSFHRELTKKLREAESYFTKALDDFASVAKINPTISEAYQQMGDLYYNDLDQTELAIKFYSKASSIDPRNPHPYRSLACVHFDKNGDATTAIELILSGYRACNRRQEVPVLFKLLDFLYSQSLNLEEYGKRKQEMSEEMKWMELYSEKTYKKALYNLLATASKKTFVDIKIIVA